MLTLKIIKLNDFYINILRSEILITETFARSHHRLRGSASPVLTATHHSYGSPRLSDFFSGSRLEVRPPNRF